MQATVNWTPVRLLSVPSCLAWMGDRWLDKNARNPGCQTTHRSELGRERERNTNLRSRSLWNLVPHPHLAPHLVVLLGLGLGLVCHRTRLVFRLDLLLHLIPLVFHHTPSLLLQVI